MGKKTTVLLRCEAIGAKEFEISHAERLLNLKKNGGWELSDKEFVFENGTINRANKGTDKGAKEKTND